MSPKQSKPLKSVVEAYNEQCDRDVIEMVGEITLFAAKNNQMVGENNDYFITLWQLDSFIKKHFDV